MRYVFSYLGLSLCVCCLSFLMLPSSYVHFALVLFFFFFASFPDYLPR